jgi:hypothetical protein
MSATESLYKNGELGHTARWSALRAFAGPPNAFWPEFLAASGELTGAMRGMLLRKSGADQAEWRKLGEWTAANRQEPMQTVFTQEWLDLVEDCKSRGGAVRTLGRQSKATVAQHGVAIRLQLPEKEETCIGAFLLPEGTPAQAEEALRRLTLVADVPVSYASTRSALRSREDLEKLASVLDVLAEFNAEKHFLAAAISLCNNIATRFKCDRVTLGWVQKGYVRLQAMSRTERFNPKMAAVAALETAMEESADQDEEVIYPPPEGATFISRDHERFAKEHKVDHMASIPLRLDDQSLGIITCERQAAAFTQVELQQLRLLADQVTRRLADLKKSDRWFGARLAASFKEQAGKLIGPEHTWAKLIGLLVATLLVLAVTIKVPYRVEAKFILRTEVIAFVSAPFKGFIQEAPVRPGDAVSNGQLVLRLNTDEMLLEESAALAEITRYARESERARASNSLAEMRVALSMVDQAKARLDLVRYRLGQAQIKSPFDGAIIEGDLRERIGSPVDQGETLMKVAETSKLYVEAEVPERDIHVIKEGMTGEIAFISQPDLKSPVRLVKLEPAAVPKEGNNVFLVRCATMNGATPWWRPGMSGICKLDAGKRTLLWIATHRTIDFLRLWLWW